MNPSEASSGSLAKRRGSLAGRSSTLSSKASTPINSARKSSKSATAKAGPTSSSATTVSAHNATASATGTTTSSSNKIKMGGGVTIKAVPPSTTKHLSGGQESSSSSGSLTFPSGVGGGEVVALYTDGTPLEEHLDTHRSVNSDDAASPPPVLVTATARTPSDSSVGSRSGVAAPLESALAQAILLRFHNVLERQEQVFARVDTAVAASAVAARIAAEALEGRSSSAYTQMGGGGASTATTAVPSQIRPHGVGSGGLVGDERGTSALTSCSNSVFSPPTGATLQMPTPTQRVSVSARMMTPEEIRLVSRLASPQPQPRSQPSLQSSLPTSSRSSPQPPPLVAATTTATTAPPSTMGTATSSHNQHLSGAFSKAAEDGSIIYLRPDLDKVRGGAPSLSAKTASSGRPTNTTAPPTTNSNSPTTAETLDSACRSSPPEAQVIKPFEKLDPPSARRRGTLPPSLLESDNVDKETSFASGSVSISATTHANHNSNSNSDYYVGGGSGSLARPSPKKYQHGKGKGKSTGPSSVTSTPDSLAMTQGGLGVGPTTSPKAKGSPSGGKAGRPTRQDDSFMQFDDDDDGTGSEYSHPSPTQKDPPSLVLSSAEVKRPGGGRLSPREDAPKQPQRAMTTPTSGTAPCEVSQTQDEAAPFATLPRWGQPASLGAIPISDASPSHGSAGAEGANGNDANTSNNLGSSLIGVLTVQLASPGSVSVSPLSRPLSVWDKSLALGASATPQWMSPGTAGASIPCAPLAEGPGSQARPPPLLTGSSLRPSSQSASQEREDLSLSPAASAGVATRLPSAVAPRGSAGALGSVSPSLSPSPASLGTSVDRQGVVVSPLTNPRTPMNQKNGHPSRKLPQQQLVLANSGDRSGNRTAASPPSAALFPSTSKESLSQQPSRLQLTPSSSCDALADGKSPPARPGGRGQSGAVSQAHVTHRSSLSSLSEASPLHPPTNDSAGAAMVHPEYVSDGDMNVSTPSVSLRTSTVNSSSHQHPQRQNSAQLQALQQPKLEGTLSLDSGVFEERLPTVVARYDVNSSDKDVSASSSHLSSAQPANGSGSPTASGCADGGGGAVMKSAELMATPKGTTEPDADRVGGDHGEEVADDREGPTEEGAQEGLEGLQEQEPQRRVPPIRTMRRPPPVPLNHSTALSPMARHKRAKSLEAGGVVLPDDGDDVDEEATSMTPHHHRRHSHSADTAGAAAAAAASAAAAAAEKGKHDAYWSNYEVMHQLEHLPPDLRDLNPFRDAATTDGAAASGPAVVATPGNEADSQDHPSVRFQTPREPLNDSRADDTDDYEDADSSDGFIEEELFLSEEDEEYYRHRRQELERNGSSSEDLAAAAAGYDDADGGLGWYRGGTALMVVSHSTHNRRVASSRRRGSRRGSGLPNPVRQQVLSRRGPQASATDGSNSNRSGTDDVSTDDCGAAVATPPDLRNDGASDKGSAGGTEDWDLAARLEELADFQRRNQQALLLDEGGAGPERREPSAREVYNLNSASRRGRRRGSLGAAVAAMHSPAFIVEPPGPSEVIEIVEVPDASSASAAAAAAAAAASAPSSSPPEDASKAVDSSKDGPVEDTSDGDDDSTPSVLSSTPQIEYTDSHEHLPPPPSPSSPTPAPEGTAAAVVVDVAAPINVNPTAPSPQIVNRGDETPDSLPNSAQSAGDTTPNTLPLREREPPSNSHQGQDGRTTSPSPAPVEPGHSSSSSRARSKGPLPLLSIGNLLESAGDATSEKPRPPPTMTVTTPEDAAAKGDPSAVSESPAAAHDGEEEYYDDDESTSQLPSTNVRTPTLNKTPRYRFKHTPRGTSQPNAFSKTRHKASLIRADSLLIGTPSTSTPVSAVPAAGDRKKRAAATSAEEAASTAKEAADAAAAAPAAAPGVRRKKAGVGKRPAFEASAAGKKGKSAAVTVAAGEEGDGPVTATAQPTRRRRSLGADEKQSFLAPAGQGAGTTRDEEGHDTGTGGRAHRSNSTGLTSGVHSYQYYARNPELLLKRGKIVPRRRASTADAVATAVAPGSASQSHSTTNEENSGSLDADKAPGHEVNTGKDDDPGDSHAVSQQKRGSPRGNTRRRFSEADAAPPSVQLNAGGGGSHSHGNAPGVSSASFQYYQQRLVESKSRTRAIETTFQPPSSHKGSPRGGGGDGLESVDHSLNASCSLQLPLTARSPLGAAANAAEEANAASSAATGNPKPLRGRAAAAAIVLSSAVGGRGAATRPPRANRRRRLLLPVAHISSKAVRGQHVGSPRGTDGIPQQVRNPSAKRKVKSGKEGGAGGEDTATSLSVQAGGAQGSSHGTGEGNPVSVVLPTTTVIVPRTNACGDAGADGRDDCDSAANPVLSAHDAPLVSHRSQTSTGSGGDPRRRDGHADKKRSKASGTGRGGGSAPLQRPQAEVPLTPHSTSDGTNTARNTAREHHQVTFAADTKLPVTSADEAGSVARKRKSRRSSSLRPRRARSASARGADLDDGNSTGQPKSRNRSLSISEAHRRPSVPGGNANSAKKKGKDAAMPLEDDAKAITRGGEASPLRTASTKKRRGSLGNALDPMEAPDRSRSISARKKRVLAGGAVTAGAGLGEAKERTRPAAAAGRGA